MPHTRPPASVYPDDTIFHNSSDYLHLPLHHHHKSLLWYCWYSHSSISELSKCCPTPPWHLLLQTYYLAWSILLDSYTPPHTVLLYAFYGRFSYMPDSWYLASWYLVMPHLARALLRFNPHCVRDSLVLHEWLYLPLVSIQFSWFH